MNYFASGSNTEEESPGLRVPRPSPPPWTVSAVGRARGRLPGPGGGLEGSGLHSALEAAAARFCPSRMPLHSVDSELWVLLCPGEML